MVYMRVISSPITPPWPPSRGSGPGVTGLGILSQQSGIKGQEKGKQVGNWGFYAWLLL